MTQRSLERKRVPQLDGVRGVAILLVIMWHFFPCQIVSDSSHFLIKSARLFSLTWSGVDLFFVLSGFLIAGILFDEKGSANYFSVFYLRRSLRILPLYLLLFFGFLQLSIIGVTSKPSFEWLFAHPMPLWSYLIFVQNVFMGGRGNFGANWLGITWSLAVEEQFYLFLPLMILIFSRRSVVSICICGGLLAPLLGCMWPGFHAFVDLPWRLDSLLAGALLAAIVRSPPLILAIETHHRIAPITFVVLLSGAGIMTFRPDPFGAFNHLWLTGLYASLILLAFLGQPSLLKSILQWRPLMWLGTRSYGIYMIHQAASGLLHGLIRSQPPRIVNWGDAGITAVALMVTLVIAALSFRYLEHPLLRYGHTFKYRTAVAAPVS